MKGDAKKRRCRQTINEEKCLDTEMRIKGCQTLKLWHAFQHFEVEERLILGFQRGAEVLYKMLDPCQRLVDDKGHCALNRGEMWEEAAQRSKTFKIRRRCDCIK
ncbi:hypothetical protein O6H91_07G017000 [Diphasiastrum complanatum]|uniref:Uncharacterized protein n=1 Tax=Diphasiastrum complanatum TaxID=34168 RepID=A0ACC2D3M5_DIPCM|nr:hypothetical protein O6H91_07G017000 [Diphasiastrum complanatum]